MKLAYAMCGSFCTHARALDALSSIAPGNEVTPVLSETVQTTDTRFGRAEDLYNEIKKITGQEPITSIKQAEETITRGGYDALIVSPCTGNTLAKTANGITDTTVTMCIKAQLRNRRPVIIAIATNDGLGANLFNIAQTIEKKNIYFVPFGQDAPTDKPASLICDFSLLGKTLASALKGIQLQPVLV